MGNISTIGALIKKDIISELRNKEMFSSMFLFALLTLLIFNFAFNFLQAGMDELAPGILWVAFTFSGILGLNRSFLQERENDCIHGLRMAPVDRGTIFIGKMISNLIFISIIEAIILPIFIIFFNLPFSKISPGLLLVMALSTLGFTSVGTLFAAMATSTRTREVLLPILLFPIIVPVIISAVKATGKIMAGKSMAEVASWLKLLSTYDLIFVVISFLIFEHVLEE